MLATVAADTSGTRGGVAPTPNGETTGHQAHPDLPDTHALDALLDPQTAQQPTGATPALLTAADEVALAYWMEAGALAEHQLAARLNPTRGHNPQERDPQDPDRATDDELRDLAHIGHLAHERFLAANLRLVHWATRRHLRNRARTPALSYDDLIAAGIEGLNRAVHKFDYTRGNKFSTYAHRWISAFQQRAEQQATGLPTALHSQLTHIRRTEADLTHTLGRTPTRTELATAAGLSADRIDEIRHTAETTNATQHHSLDAPLTPQTTATLHDIHPTTATAAASPVTAAPGALTGALNDPRLQAALHALHATDPRAHDVLCALHGLDGAEPQTPDQLAAHHNIAPHLIHRAAERGLDQLRTHISTQARAATEPPRRSPEEGTRAAPDTGRHLHRDSTPSTHLEESA